MADLSNRVPELENQSLVAVVAVLFLIAFGIKAAVFPLYFWLPASYHTLPISVTAVFAALMTKVGIYALMRTFTLIFPGEHAGISTTLLCLGLITMILGVFGALTHSDIRRILAFHVIGSIGFMLLGLGLGSQIAMGAAIFYMVHGILIKALLFMIAGLIGKLGGSFELSKLGGLYQERPGFSILFLLAALSLIGIPPLSGFWAKVLIIDAGLHHEAAVVIGFVVVTSLLTFIPLMRIWSEAFWKARPAQSVPVETAADKYAWPPVLGLSVVMLVIGFMPSAIINMSDEAAQNLLSREEYINTVLPQQVTTNEAQTQ